FMGPELLWRGDDGIFIEANAFGGDDGTRHGDSGGAWISQSSGAVIAIITSLWAKKFEECPPKFSSTPCKASMGDYERMDAPALQGLSVAESTAMNAKEILQYVKTYSKDKTYKADPCLIAENYEDCKRTFPSTERMRR